MLIYYARHHWYKPLMYIYHKVLSLQLWLMQNNHKTNASSCYTMDCSTQYMTCTYHCTYLIISLSHHEYTMNYHHFPQSSCSTYSYRDNNIVYFHLSIHADFHSLLVWMLITLSLYSVLPFMITHYRSKIFPSLIITHCY